MALRGNYAKLATSLKKLDAIVQGEVQRKITKNVGAEFLDLTLEGFTTSTDPYGDRWADLKYRDGQPLRDKGHLASAFNVEYSDTGFTIHNPVPYGIHHQFGAPKANIPARPMLPKSGSIPKAWAEIVEEVALETLQLALK